MQTFKTAYAFCPKTGVFLREILCFYSAADGIYPLPPSATFIEPPFSEDQVPFFDGTKWSLHPPVRQKKKKMSPLGAWPIERQIDAILGYFIGEPENLLALTLLKQQLKEEGLRP